MYHLKTEEEVIRAALNILEQRLEYLDPDAKMDSPNVVKPYLALELMGLEHEVFGCLWLNNRHNLIRNSIMFRGTIDCAAVYPREVVKEALGANAAAVIIYHNHPSGDPEPSTADRALTERLKTALGTVDIRLLDHIVVGGSKTVSFAEKGLI